ARKVTGRESATAASQGILARRDCVGQCCRVLEPAEDAVALPALGVARDGDVDRVANVVGQLVRSNCDRRCTRSRRERHQGQYYKQSPLHDDLSPLSHASAAGQARLTRQLQLESEKTTSPKAAATCTLQCRRTTDPTVPVPNRPAPGHP